MRFQVFINRIPVYIDTDLSRDKLVDHFAQRGFDNIDIGAPLELPSDWTYKVGFYRYEVSHILISYFLF